MILIFDLSQADQRFIEYRSRIAEVACKVVGNFFDINTDEEWRREYINAALGNKRNPPFIWKNFSIDGFPNVKSNKYNF